MNIIFQVLNLIIVIITINLITGCSNSDLSRDEAEKLLKPKTSNIETKEFEIYTGGLSNLWETNKFALSRKLEKLGLVEIIWYRYGHSNAIKKMALSEEGKQYVISMGGGSVWNSPIAMCKISDIEFGEVTGISQQEGSNYALVKYTLHRKVTPFGKAIGLQDGFFENSANFALFDDGWRLQ